MRSSSHGFRPKHVAVIVSVLILSATLCAQTDRPPGTPFHGTPWSVPGTIVAKEFDLGGPGVASYATHQRASNQERTDTQLIVYSAVQLEAEEWVQYTVQVASSAWYDLAVEGGFSQGHSWDDPINYVHCGPRRARGTLRLESDGVAIAPEIGPDLTPVGKEPVVLQERIYLPAGVQTLRLIATTTATNVCFGPDPHGYGGEISEDAIPFSIVGLRLSPSVKPRVAFVHAGDGSRGFADGAGSLARFGSIDGVCADANGGVFVGDSINHRVRRVSPAGEVTTLAGTGRPGGDDGPATVARFDQIQSLAVEANGNLLVLDYPAPEFSDSLPSEYRLRRTTPEGTVTTLFRGRVETDFAVPGPPIPYPWWDGDWYYRLERVEVLDGRPVLIGSHWQWRWKDGQQTERKLVYGAFEVTPHGWQRLAGPVGLTPGAVTNLAGVAFWQSGDRLLRQGAGESPRTVYRHPSLGRVLTVSGEEVVAVQGLSLVRIKETADAMCSLHASLPLQGGTVLGVPYWPVPAGTKVRLEAVPDYYKDFGGWGGDADGTNRVLEFEIQGDLRIEAYFGYTLSLLAQDCTARVNPERAVYREGESVTISVIPNSGFTHLFWHDGKASAERVVTFNNGWSWAGGVVAWTPQGESLDPPVITATHGWAGKVRVQYPTPMVSGAPAWFWAEPGRGYQFSRWDDGDTNPFRVRPLSSGMKIHAEFVTRPEFIPMLVPVGVSADRRWFHLQVHGYPFTAYQAWSSSDLVEWEPWSPQIFTDEYGRGFGRQPYHPADPARFFRFAPGGR